MEDKVETLVEGEKGGMVDKVDTSVEGQKGDMENKDMQFVFIIHLSIKLV